MRPRVTSMDSRAFDAFKRDEKGLLVMLNMVWASLEILTFRTMAFVACLLCSEKAGLDSL